MEDTKEISEMARKLGISNEMEQYDEHAKNLLSQKIILAHILIHTVEYYIGMPPEAVVSLIEGTPQVSEVPLLPGETNMPDIIGSNTEDAIPYEGRVTFDIRFTAWTPDKGQRLKLIVDMEAQKNYYPGYDIVTRAVFHTARLISSQYGTEFTKSNYKDIKKVYSIFICMNVPKYAENTITEYRLSEFNKVGQFPQGKVYYDIPHIIIVGLAKSVAEEKDEYRLHRLLETMFSEALTIDEKKDILENEYGIAMTEESGRRAEAMCNFSEAILERGLESGALRKLVMQVCCKLRKGKEAAQIADELEEDIEQINNICEAARHFAPDYDEEKVCEILSF
ncbi:MAG: Rpn family recombination-promoting nuclease/putative transposase [Lachnospiraceae bacterium]|nr:Rpn family recombination-promoting nuclease/putative transposase [Lachnospiraceae bacterium]